MNNFNGPLYFCCECKKTVNHLDDLLFIDEHSHKGFCSEECIEYFYFPIIKHYESSETSFRRKHDLANEFLKEAIIDSDLIESTLDSPNEVFRQSNELSDSFYHFIKHFSEYSIVVISSVYNKEASFVFLVTKTHSQLLLNEFRTGEKMNDWSMNIGEKKILELEKDDNHLILDNDIDNDEEEDMIFIQLLESKKSNLLAEILMNRKDSDIPFEDYTGYESCFQETLDFPDEVFERKDKEGDMIFTYIKAFSRGHETFYYIVTCLKRVVETDNVNVYPILALPTVDLELCQEFRGGTRLSGPLKN